MLAERKERAGAGADADIVAPARTARPVARSRVLPLLLPCSRPSQTRPWNTTSRMVSTACKLKAHAKFAFALTSAIVHACDAPRPAEWVSEQLHGSGGSDRGGCGECRLRVDCGMAADGSLFILGHNAVARAC